MRERLTQIHLVILFFLISVALRVSYQMMYLKKDKMC